MANYTTVLQKPLDTAFWEDDNFIEELLEIAQLFRPFSDAITEFISDRGYEGNSEDVVQRRLLATISVIQIVCFLK